MRREIGKEDMKLKTKKGWLLHVLSWLGTFSIRFFITQTANLAVSRDHSLAVALIYSSRLNDRKGFQRWVTHDKVFCH